MFALDTPRLLIRPWEDADRPSFVAMASDPEVMRHVHGGVPYADDEIDEFLARQARQAETFGVCMGAMIEKSSGRVVGVAGAQPFADDVEIGWWLARDVWGRGYATEAGGAAMRHVLNVMRRPRVVAVIDPGNDASRRVVDRLGMTFEGTFTGAQLRYRKPEIVLDLFVKAGGA